MSTALPFTPVAAPPNWALIRRLFGLAWRYRLHCLQVLGIQLLLLTMGIVGLSFTGLGIDYIRHRMDGTPLTANLLHLTLPVDWLPLQVLALLLCQPGCRRLLGLRLGHQVEGGEVGRGIAAASHCCW